MWGPNGVRLSDPKARAQDYGASGQVDNERLRIAWTHQRAPFSWSFDIYVAEYALGGQRLVPPAGLPLHADARSNVLRGFAHDPQGHVALAVFDVEIVSGSLVGWDVAGSLYQTAP